MSKTRETLIGDQASVTDWIHFCREAAVEAYNEVIDGDGEVAARYAGGEVWKANMPLMVDRHTVIAYIACAAAGFAEEFLETDDVKLMMYAAQCQLSALRVVGK